MKRALVIGASGGIGAALAARLADTYEVTALSRALSGLEITDELSVARVLGALDGPFERVIIATGILAPPGAGPEKSLNALTAAAMAEVFAVNAIGPALVLKHLAPLLPRDMPCTVGVLTARVGSIGDNGLGGWYSYRASKAATNQIVRTASIELGRKFKHASIVALHPGTVDTPFTAGYPAHKKVSADEAAGHLLGVMNRLAPADTGQFFDWKGEAVPW